MESQANLVREARFLPVIVFGLFMWHTGMILASGKLRIGECHESKGTDICLSPSVEGWNFNSSRSRAIMGAASRITAIPITSSESSKRARLYSVSDISGTSFCLRVRFQRMYRIVGSIDNNPTSRNAVIFTQKKVKVDAFFEEKHAQETDEQQ